MSAKLIILGLVAIVMLVVIIMLVVKGIMMLVEFFTRWWFPILVTGIFIITAIFINLDTAWPVPLLGGAIAAGWKIYHKLF